MANGYCLPLLQHIEALASCNPANKLQPLGMTQAILSNMDGSATLKQTINEGYEDGHIRDTTVVYRKRVLESEVSDEENACDNASMPSKFEFELPDLHHRSVSFWMPDNLIRQYCKDVSQYVKLNSDGMSEMNQSSSVMKEVYDNIIAYGRPLLESIETLLVTQMATQFGNNVVTESSDASNLRFSLGANGMQDAFVRLMSDLRENEICDNVTIVGNGDFADIDLIRKWFASAAADNGVNKAAMLADIPRVFFSKKTRAIWGANHIGVFEKGATSLITRNKYTGSFARKLANSEFFTMALPVAEYCCPQEYLDKLMFDFQIREIDCPTTLEVNGQNQTVSQGVQVIMSWNGSLFVKPDLYEEEDELTGTNGTLRYHVTSCDDPCGSFGGSL